MIMKKYMLIFTIFIVTSCSNNSDFILVGEWVSENGTEDAKMLVSANRISLKSKHKNYSGPFKNKFIEIEGLENGKQGFLTVNGSKIWWLFSEDEGNEFVVLEFDDYTSYSFQKNK